MSRLQAVQGSINTPILLGPGEGLQEDAIGKNRVLTQRYTVVRQSPLFQVLHEAEKSIGQHQVGPGPDRGILARHGILPDDAAEKSQGIVMIIAGEKTVILA